MYNHNNLMSVEYDGTTLKFNTLIVFKYFCKVSKSSEFKQKTKNISNKIKKLFKKYYLDNNIDMIEDGKLINDHIEIFIKLITKEISSDIENLFNFFNEFQAQSNNHKSINLEYTDFESEMIRTFFMRILKIRQLFFVD